MTKGIIFLLFILINNAAFAADGTPTNFTAIAMFAAVVGLSLFITFRAA